KMVEEECPVIAPKEGGARPVRYGDIAVLFRAHTAVPFFEEAFRRLDVPISSEGGRGFYETIEVAAAGAVLRAVIHPGDPLALAAALRSPLYGFSDVDLARWRLHPPDDPRHPAGVAEAVEEIREMHEGRNGRSARGVLEEIFRRTQAYELFLSAFYGEQRVANLLKLLDVAFEYERGGVRGVDEFGAFLQRQLKQGKDAREAEAGLSDGDENDVRFMTIHAAKGLEFPVVAMADLSGGSSNDPPARIADRAGGKLFLNVGPEGRRLRTAGFGEALEREKEIEEAEGRRLLYVAATRARDYLIWPVFVSEKEKGAWKALEEAGAGAEAMREGACGPADILTGVQAGGEGEISYLRFRDEVFEVDEAQVRRAERGREEIERELAALREAGDAAGFITPSGLVGPMGGSPGEDDDEAERYGVSDLESGGEARGRKFGSLVHELLARLEPPAPGAVERLAGDAGALAAGRGLDGAAGEEALDLLRRAAEGDLLKRAAASSRRYRELPFLMEIEGRPVRGTADLVFEEEGGLVVVDFKTDAISAGEAPERMKKYANQGVAYEMGIGAASGQDVREVIFAFLRPGVDVPLPVDKSARESLRRAVREEV
ncbi:MAG: 3'-5' exonuclease, partial [bacterium]